MFQLAVLCLISLTVSLSHAQADASTQTTPTKAIESSKANNDATDSQDPILAKLNSLLSQTQTIKAQFKQLMVDQQSNALQEAQGEILAKRPGSFRWQTNAPYQQLTVTNGTTLWLYDQDLEQVTVYDVNDQMKNTPAALLSGDLDSLAKNFDITGAPQDNDQWVFEMTPKQANDLFESLRLKFNQGVLSEMIIQDKLGQLSSFQFSEVTTNFSVDATTFEFNPPAGVDVIQQSNLPTP